MINKVYLYFLVFLTVFAAFQAQSDEGCNCQIAQYNENGIEKIRFMKDKSAHDKYLYAGYLYENSLFENLEQLVKLLKLEPLSREPNGTESNYIAPPKSSELIIISSDISLDDSQDDLMRPYHVSPVDNLNSIQAKANDNQGSKGAGVYDRIGTDFPVPEKIKAFKGIDKGIDICKISNR